MDPTLHTPTGADIAYSRVRVGNREIVDRFPTVDRNFRPSQWFKPTLERIQVTIQGTEVTFCGCKVAGLGPLSII